MAKTAKKKKSGRTKKSGLLSRVARWISSPFATLRFLLVRGVLIVVAVGLLLVVLFAFVNPPTTHTMWSEGRRLGTPVKQEWVDFDEIAPVMARAAVAAEDANFCLHWGFDVTAIRAAITAGSRRGGSTISQQVVKNVFLWQDRSWLRKALEASDYSRCRTDLVKAAYS